MLLTVSQRATSTYFNTKTLYMITTRLIAVTTVIYRVGLANQFIIAIYYFCAFQTSQNSLKRTYIYIIMFMSQSALPVGDF